MTTIRVYRVLVYEGDAAAIQKNLDRRSVKDIRVSTDYTIQEAVLGNIILPEPDTSPSTAQLKTLFERGIALGQEMSQPANLVTPEWTESVFKCWLKDTQ